MTPNTLLKALAAFFFFTAVPASDASNSSQHVVANSMADESVDPATVQQYKRLFAVEEASSSPPFASAPVDQTVFDHAFRWTDVVDAVGSTSTCHPTCYACPAGCNVACCVGRGNTTLPVPVSSKEDPKPAVKASRTILPSPLACPCYCGVNCPPQIADICCVTAGAEKAAAAEANGQKQKPLGATTANTLHEDSWSRTQDCPCHCETSCPASIQEICCVTAGSGAVDDAAAATTTTTADSGSDPDLTSGGGETAAASAPVRERKAQTPNQTGLVMQTASGDPVSVLTAVNLTIDQSFITLDLIRGLERTEEIVFVESGHFEIVLDVAVSPEDKAKAEALKQSFQVIDGSKLREREQVLLGRGLMARIGGLRVDADVLAEVVGLPVLTGTRKTG